MSDSQNKSSSVILNVDDNEAMRYARKRVLAQAGYHIIDAETGEKALHLAATEKPDLILLDVSLPGMNGIEVCRHIKADKELSYISILQVSGSPTFLMNQAAGIEGGADGYLVEPIHPIELVATVRTLLRLAHREQEHRHMIGQLSRLQRQFADATNAADCGLWDWDIVSGKLEWFGAHERLAGMLPGGFNGKIEAFSEILHPDDRTRVWNKVQGCMDACKEHFTEEYRFVHPDGSIHWMTARGRFYYDAAGLATRMTGVVQDITDRKQTGEMLRLLDRALHASDAGILMVDATAEDLPIIFASAGFERLTGYKAADVLGRNCQFLQGPQTDRIQVERLRAALNTGHPIRLIIRNYRKDGTAFWNDLAISPVHDRTGRLTHFVGVQNDVTTLIDTQSALRESEERWRLAVEGADLGSWDVDLRTGLVAWNERHGLMQGYSSDRPASFELWQKLIHQDDRDRVMANIEQAKREHKPFDEEHRFYRADTGELRWMSLYGGFSYDQNGQPVRFSGVSLDVTDRKQAEEVLRRSKDELEVRVRERTRELLAMQTRLMAVTSQLSLTEQQERRKLAHDLHDYLAQLLVVGGMKTKLLAKQVASLPTGATLIQDLDHTFQQALTYTRTLIAELSPPSLHEAGLPAALKWLGDRFEKDGLMVQMRTDCDSVPLPEENAVVVFQAVRELLFNVLKHSGVRQAAVTLTLDSDHLLRVAVADRGKGFTPVLLQGSVEPGHLGLVSLRGRFHAMGGRVEVESVVEHGTTVTLILPIGEEMKGRTFEAQWGDAETSSLPSHLTRQ